MPRYEYRNIQPTAAAEKAYSAWIAQLDAAFSKRDPEHSANVVRDALHELYLGRRYAPPTAEMPLAQQAQLHSFDPRNASLEPEYYGDVDAAKYTKPFVPTAIPRPSSVNSPPMYVEYTSGEPESGSIFATNASCVP